jgi:predicted Rossmann fold nucleotide-binding protein DprA/Smf involved in DNA uptake
VITSSQDILRELGFTATEGTSSSIDLDQLGLSDDERMICSHLVHERLTSTDIMERTSLSITRINVALTGLEMRGLVTQRMGTYGLHISS